VSTSPDIDPEQCGGQRCTALRVADVTRPCSNRSDTPLSKDAGEDADSAVEAELCRHAPVRAMYAASRRDPFIPG